MRNEKSVNYYKLTEMEVSLQAKRNEWLVENGLIQAINSVEEYESLVRAYKHGTSQKVFSNCYLMTDEIRSMIGKGFFQIPAKGCVAFVSEEITHWKLYLYTDLCKRLVIPKLDKSILTEIVYRNSFIPKEQERFRRGLENVGFIKYSTYDQINLKPTIPAEEYWKRLHVLEKVLKKEGVLICSPSDEQIPAFESIYREQIDIYIQKRFSINERLQQRDQGLLRCIINQSGEICAINVSVNIYGGAIAVSREAKSNIYALALAFKIYEDYFTSIGAKGAETNDRPKEAAKGWIAKTNSASRRLHEKLGMQYTEKAFDQYILPGFLY